MELWKVEKYPSFTYVSLYNNDLSCNFKGVQSTYTCCLIEMFVPRGSYDLEALIRPLSSRMLSIALR